MKPINNTVKCDLCHRTFAVTSSSLEEKKVTLMKEPKEFTIVHDVIITVLTCPCCGKSYPVTMDDNYTQELLEHSKDLYQRRMKWIAQGKAVPSKLQEKFDKARIKLGISRQKLAKEYNGSFYQLKDGTVEQLDFRYRER